MDLGTILVSNISFSSHHISLDSFCYQKNYEDQVYMNEIEVVADTRQVWMNCLIFNQVRSLSLGSVIVRRREGQSYMSWVTTSLITSRVS
jgi:hypothetical protein